MDGREVRVVKGIIMLALILLTGCAGYTPLKQLEAQALLSGDWSFVEKRERMETRRNLQSNMQCPPPAPWATARPTARQIAAVALIRK